MERLRKHHISFRNAASGLGWAFTSQPNFRIHFTLSLFVLFLGFVFQVTYVEMVLLVLTIVFGLGIEMVNTAIEAMTDLITTQWHREAKIAKDVSAGMMLLAAVGAIFVALLIFLPRFWSLLIHGMY